ncbi:MAG: protein-disulfide reductase DsbD [Nevskia sp.]|nr:protein-disulfide reductase DsbD [Nevskia sp.]
MKAWSRRLLAVLLGASALAAAAAAEDFLDVDQAFRLAAATAADGRTSLRFEVAQGYHLYRERISVEAAAPDVRLGPLQLPQGSMEHDAAFGRDVEVYRGQVEVPLAFDARPTAAQAALVRVAYQGCADAGLCYPPQTREVSVPLGPAGAAVAPAAPAAATDAKAAPAATVTPARATLAPPPGGASRIQSALQSGRLLSIAAVFAVAGLLLSFTPCVLPMVPILSSIIVGQGGGGGRGRGFRLALAYALGMALVYTAFGVVAGLLGEGLAAWLQNPWVLGSFGLLMTALALSMFGVYELQLPSALQTRLTVASSRIKGGNSIGAFAMGGVSALIVGPCVAAPLAGALVYISQTHDVVVGGLALFALASGMSVPLLLVGLSAGALLPRAGAWMVSVKTFFGVVLLAVAWWLVSPVLPVPAAMLLLAVLLALAAALLGAFTALEARAGVGRVARKAGGWVLACVAVAQVAGALAGADSPWQPLRPLAGRAVAGEAAASLDGAVHFVPVASAEALERALHDSGGRPVVLDFYADWCVSCKEMEHSTFADPRIRQRLGNALLLQADVTANTEAQRALLKRFGLFGPPGVLFFDPRGQELRDARAIGFEDAAEFLKRLDAAGVL